MKTLEPCICIAGPSQSQNKLLAYFLYKTIKIKCRCYSNLSPRFKKSKPITTNNLVLWNCPNQSPLDVLEYIEQHCSTKGTPCKIALVNVPEDSGLVMDSIDRGIKGIFYANDSLDILEKGIQAILNGDLWYSRDDLSASIQNSQKGLNQGKSRPPNILTRREQEILELIASGLSNDDISKELHISPHTVKTHINNIYSKIKAPNRIQAVLWAVKNL